MRDRSILLLARALRVTAGRLAAGADYRWTHLGMCNCGQLAQTVTGLSREEIRRMALEKPGEWADQAVDYCPESGYPIDHVIGKMLELGLTREDIGHLEKLSCPKVLRRLPVAERLLDHRDRDHVVRYMTAWAEMLEDELAAEADSPPEALSRARRAA
ncbi:MAG: hypothetical protein ACREQY_05020 [Candidatus Binatia bacterium]